MSSKSKQAERNAQKRAAKKDSKDEPEPVSASSSVVPTFGLLGDRLKKLFLGACLVKVAPQLQPLLQGQNGFGKKDEPKKEEEEPKKEENETENKQEETEETSAKQTEDLHTAEGLFSYLGARLQWFNTLGLAEPASAQEAKDKWLMMKGLEVDGGAKKAKRGNPAMDRIMKNVYEFLPQYLHVLLVLLCLRALLFRSWFACLPWLVGYQAASLLVPLEMTKDVPLKFRVVATAAFNGLVWLFVLYELLRQVWWIELFFTLPGFIIVHAYVAKPLDGK